MPEQQRRPQRDSYADVGQRTRQSTERALAAGATLRQIAVLHGVHYWLTTFSNVSDAVSLARIAQSSGIWKGTTDDCPRWALKRVAAEAKELDRMGAVTYSPSTAGRGLASRLTLPAVAEGSVLHTRGGSIDGREGGAAAATPSVVERGSRSRSERGSRSRSDGGAVAGPKGGAAAAPPHEDVSRTESTRTVRDARDTTAVRSLANRLTAIATTDAQNQNDRDWLDYEATAVADVIIGPYQLDDMVTDLVDLVQSVPADNLPRPIEYLSYLDESMFATDARYTPLVDRHPFTIAQACALANGTHWTDHADEAQDLVHHWRQCYGDDLTAEAATVVRVRGLARPARPQHADRIMRDEILAEAFADEPYVRFQADRAQPIRRRA